MPWCIKPACQSDLRDHRCIGASSDDSDDLSKAPSTRTDPNRYRNAIDAARTRLRLRPSSKRGENLLGIRKVLLLLDRLPDHFVPSPLFFRVLAVIGLLVIVSVEKLCFFVGFAPRRPYRNIHR